MKRKSIVMALVATGAMSVSVGVIGGAADLNACCTPADHDYPTPGGNLGNQNHSSLTHVNKSNIKNLGPVWMTRISLADATTPTPSPGTDDGGQQAMPIAVDGVIYMDTPVGDVIAVDGATGAVKWKWHPTAFNPVNNDRRGVSVGDGKVFTLAGQNRVVALDKNTGAEVWVKQPVVPNEPDPVARSLGNIQKVATVYYDGMVYVGTNDGNRNSVFALRASDGELVWFFFGASKPEAWDDRIFTDVNGNTVRADFTSWGPDLNCAETSGTAPWIHGSIDPQLNSIIVAFGNVRSCGSSQDGSTRPGDNLFANTLVSLDAKTGAFKWHYQSIRHDIWDMDNTHSPVFADVNVGGQPRKVVLYGSKSGHIFSIDRTNGQPVTAVVSKPRPTDSRQSQPAEQPFPVLGRVVPECLVWEKLDANNIPGNPWRAVPNYNGYQPDPSGNLVYTEPNYLDPDKPFLTIPAAYGANHRKGCMYDTHWDLPVLSTTSQNGGMDWSGYSFSPITNALYIPYGINPVAHWRQAGGNGQRALGQYQTGGLFAMDASTTAMKWNKHTGLDMAHGQTPVTTASNLLFVGQFDGHALALDAENGNELWRFQTGAAISSPPVTYTVNGEQYVAFFAGGTGIPYGNSVTSSDMLWAFKLGGQYKTASGSQENPTPAPLQIRRNVGGAAVEGSTLAPANTVYLARASRTNDTAASADGTAAGAMSPTHMRVPVGTTVTFLNPGAATFPSFPNAKRHCATQYFEGLFNFKLDPGQSAQYTFTREGEYFFNDCTDPRPTGKIVVYAVPQELPGAVKFVPSEVNMRSPTGVFTGVQGVLTARFDIPSGYTFDGNVKLKTPLSTTLFSPVSTSVSPNGKTLVASFNQADIDNNVPAGDSVALTLSANFLHNGAQKQLTSTDSVKIIK